MSEDRETASGRPPERKHGPTPTERKLPDGQHADHWVLSLEERAKGYLRPVRATYKHETCGGETHMGSAIATTYAAMPSFYTSTYCASCKEYYPVGAEGEFVWRDGTKVGT